VRLLTPLVPPLCLACRAPAPGSWLCASCRRALDWLPTDPVALRGLRVWAPLAYEGPARALVGRLKYHGALQLADHMAAMVAAGAPRGLIGLPLVPVPMPAARRRLRGFDHALLLARALGRRTGAPCRALLGREGAVRQVGRTRTDRLRDPPRFSALSAGTEAVVLVDDVVTTGATVAACAAALGAAGWSCAGALAFARTPVR